MATLDGCTDVDISVTPFTNTLPIRRLNLDQDESTEIETVYISVPELQVETAIQRYTCLDSLDDEGGRYRYESVPSGFTAEFRSVQMVSSLTTQIYFIELPLPSES